MNLLKKLSEAQGPSGNESVVRAIIKKELKPYVDEMYTDKYGNLIARQKGKGVSVMLAAHMDEVGLMVGEVDREGKIFISAIGGLEPITLLGENVQLITSKGKKLEGLITTRNIHDSHELEELPGMGNLYVDVGMTKEEVDKVGVIPGDYVYIVKDYLELGEGGNFVSGKALDDRVGCYMLIELAKKLKKSKADMYYVFTVQEEIGLFGAKTSVYSIDPDYAIVVDVTESGDGKMGGAVKCLGKGPVIVVKDGEMMTTRCINKWLFDIARKNKIPFQPDVSDFGTTDALNVAVSKGGLPCGVVGVAVRNIHTTTSVAHKQDIKDAIKLIELLLKNPPRICL